MIAHDIDVPDVTPPARNLGTLDRVLRVAAGAALVALGAYLFWTADALIWSLLDLATMALGTDLLVSGVRGYCPLYRKLGWSTARGSA